MDIQNFIRFTIRDVLGKREKIGTNEEYIHAGIHWLRQASSVTGDGGVAAHYSLITGWEYSYIETTGYILVTFFSLARYFKEHIYYQEAINMADFLLKNQMKCGAFPSGTPQSKNIVPRVFNTGEVIKGLVVAFQETKEKKYLRAAVKAADWLCSCQSPDGAWNKYEYMDCAHAYHTRTSHSLLMVWKETKQKKYFISAEKNLTWVLNKQHENGWFDSCNFLGASNPFTHAISYAIEGFLECYIITSNKQYWRAAELSATALLTYYEKNGYMPATFDSEWKSTDSYSCLTGDAQIILNWLDIYKKIHDKRYLKASKGLLAFLKSTVSLDMSDSRTFGAVPGAYPTYGGYNRWNFPNWATKFFIDACIQSAHLHE